MPKPFVVLMLMFAYVIASWTIGGCKGPDEKIAFDVNRYVDKEAGVVCWTHRGISCLPISETKLDR